MKYIILILLFFSTISTYSKEELVFIQTVSTGKKSFVIRRGIQEGVSIGQKSLFTNDDFSLVARAIEVTREHSLWQITNKDILVPFKKGDVLSYSKQIKDIYHEIPLLLFKPNEKSLERRMQKLRRAGNWSIKASMSRSLLQSVSGVDAQKQESQREGTQFEINKIFQIFSIPRFEMNIGGRFDYEILQQSSPSITITSKRYFLKMGATYHLRPYNSKKSNFYLGVDVGGGLSNTSVLNKSLTGTALLLPAIKIGHLKQFSNNKSFLAEIIIENIYMEEKSESNLEQSTSVTNAKISLGLRF